MLNSKCYSGCINYNPGIKTNLEDSRPDEAFNLGSFGVSNQGVMKRLQAEGSRKGDEHPA